MEWDSEDRLREVDLGGGGRAYYVYDSSGQRVRKVIESLNGVRCKERIYLGGFEVYREFESDGEAVELERESLHVMDDARRIALVETLTVEDSDEVVGPVSLRRYQLGNHLDSASVELDGEGGLISYEEFHPYGTTAFQAGRSAAEVSCKRYRYTAMERDDESGLACHGARYYASWLGRWTAADPIGIADGINAYAFSRESPVRYSDSTGLEAEEPLDNTGDPNDPSNYASFESYVAGAQGPWSIEWLRAQWDGVHASVGQAPRSPSAQSHPEVDSEVGLVESVTWFVNRYGGTAAVLNYLHAEANSRPDAGVEPDELPPAGLDWSAGAEGGLLSEPVERMLTGAVVDTLLIGAAAEVWAGTRAIWVAATKGPAIAQGATIGAAGGTARSAVAVSEEVGAVRNPIPDRMARVVAEKYGQGPMLAARSASDAWVTAAEDIAGITTSDALATRMTLLHPNGAIIRGPRAVIEFDTVTDGLATPILRNNPGFIPGGRTAGGAREFVVPNHRIIDLSNVTTRIVQ